MTYTPPVYIKWPCSFFDDERLASLPEQQQLRFSKIYHLAGILDKGGKFVRPDGTIMSVEQIAFRIRCESKALKSDIRLFKSLGLMKLNGHGLVLPNFLEEQGGKTVEERREEKRERDTRWREAQRRRASVAPSEQRRRNGGDQREEETREEERKEDKEPTPSIQPSPRAQAIGGKAVGQSSPLTKKQQGLVSQLKAVLIASGYSSSKLEDAYVTLATRNVTAVGLLVALASAYADKDAKNKASVAIHRLTHGNIPPEFKKASSWRKHLPREIREAAGITEADLVKMELRE